MKVKQVIIAISLISSGLTLLCCNLGTRSSENLVSPTATPSNKPASKIFRPSSIVIKSFDFDAVSTNGKTLKQQKGNTKYFTEDLGDSITLDMVEVPSGKFTMGLAPYSRFLDEWPNHLVTVKSFYIGKYEVTQAQWSAIAELPKVKIDLKKTPSKRFRGDDLPVEMVSWEEAVEFCRRLTQATGRPYRLPSEAEWEYAFRAKTTTLFYFGEKITTDLANYRGEYETKQQGIDRKRIMPVGSFAPNSFGLFDMCGNVQEWCEDDYHSNYKGAPIDGSTWENNERTTKVFRNCAWDSDGFWCRSTQRFGLDPHEKIASLGFRIVTVLPQNQN